MKTKKIRKEDIPALYKQALRWRIIYLFYGGTLAVLVGGFILYLGLFHGDSLIKVGRISECATYARICASTFTYVLPFGIIILMLGIISLIKGTQKLFTADKIINDAIQTKNSQKIEDYININLNSKLVIFVGVIICIFGPILFLYLKGYAQNALRFIVELLVAPFFN